MNKKNISYYCAFPLFFIFFSVPLFASSEFPGLSEDSGPLPPPPEVASIDNYLNYTILICFAFAANYFYTFNKKKLLKVEN